MSENPKIHVWITKYALTDGVIETDAELVGGATRMIATGTGFGRSHYHRNDWHTSEAEAKARVEAMIEAKAKSLQKSLAKLETLRMKASDDFGSMVKRKEGT